MEKFRKKPIIVDAIQWDGTENALLEIQTMTKEKINVKEWTFGTDLIIPTLEGEMTAEKDDWIIRGVKGELYPCKPDIFEKTYEKVT